LGLGVSDDVDVSHVALLAANGWWQAE